MRVSEERWSGGLGIDALGREGVEGGPYRGIGRGDGVDRDRKDTRAQLTAWVCVQR